MTTKEAFKSAVDAAISGDKKHGWGADDSMAVIAAIWKSETGDDIPAEAGALIRSVINPSQFRQKLESAGRLTPEPKAVKVKSMIDDLLKETPAQA